MTTTLRRLMLGIGAALLVGGWGTTQLASRHERVVGGSARDDKGRSSRPPPHYVMRWDSAYQPLYTWGIVSMAVGAGLIGFAVLRPTNRKDE